MLKKDKNTIEEIHCYHCGEACDTLSHYLNEKHFCCNGCKSVYEILNENELCSYYTYEKNPGKKQQSNLNKDRFAFLESDEAVQKLIQFREDNKSHITFYLPQMHCSSCVWLLEHLNRLNGAIIRSTVNFLRKELFVVFDHEKLSLKEVAELMASIGYEPYFSLNDLSGKKLKKTNRSRIYKIGIAGFCFGNIMLMSFPEYFSISAADDAELRSVFTILNLILSLPVLFYCSSEFFISAIQGLRKKQLNIDAPIALAIVLTFGRSIYELSSGKGPGYFDSMGGIVFFMLVGRFFQNKTYHTLSFDRDYTSYFPVAVTKRYESGEEKRVLVSELKTGDRIIIFNNEIIPADCILFKGEASIDYSFVSGESALVKKGLGEIVYAGGKQIGSSIELEIVHEVSQSYLTQLWNNSAFNLHTKEQLHNEKSFVHLLSRYFTYIVLGVAAIACVYWYFVTPSKIFDVLTTILIVACPCALLLASAFTDGNVLRYLQKAGLYLKNNFIAEQLVKADTLVFDKTGTITHSGTRSIYYTGEPFSPKQLNQVSSLLSESSHVLSRSIKEFLPACKKSPVNQFREFSGSGISGLVLEEEIVIGSAAFTQTSNTISPNLENGSEVFVKINGRVLGHFILNQHYRKGLQNELNLLKAQFSIHLLSGDNSGEKDKLEPSFGLNMRFGQQPEDKLTYISNLQKNNKKVIMLGDGLNDAGALAQSDVGIAVADNINNFSPACDAIMVGELVPKFHHVIAFCRKGRMIIKTCFIISFVYNLVGLYYSVSGNLQPVIAAILMPLSTLTIVLYTTGLTRIFGKSFLKKTESDFNHSFK